ncbi:MmpS family transport accessory protein [Nocardia arthritidis]|nr:MmpS family transport accessory protein [Nocardia arthritidis]
MTYQPPPGSGYPPPQYGYYPPPQYPPPKSKPVWPWVLGGVLLAIFLLAGGCFAIFGTVAWRLNKDANQEISVTYQVTGTASAVDVTYYTDDFVSHEEKGVSLPWRKDVKVKGIAKSASVSVISSSGGTVGCTIVHDGKTIAQQSYSSKYSASASCFGTVD